MKPDDLDDPSPLEPDDDLLVRVRANSRSRRRRRTARRLTSGLSAVLVIALAVGIALSRVDSSTSHMTATATNTTATSTTAPPTTTTTEPPRPATDAGVKGWWKLVSIAGHPVSPATPPRGEALRLNFDDGNLSNGSDGCNALYGPYRIASGGRFHFVYSVQTPARCHQAPPEALDNATRAEIAGRSLILFDRAGRALARYERVTATARLELPSRTMGGGSSMAGRVVVDNDTGAPLNASGCISYFSALLARPGLTGEYAGGLQCLGEFTFPVGESTYPIVLNARYSSCGGVPLGGGRPCLPTGGTPPLPPGDYQARLFPSDGIFQTPSPQIVDVTVDSINPPPRSGG